MSTVATPPSPTLEDRVDHINVIHGASWADYQRHLEIRGERSVPRLTFLEDRLEFMSPSRFHENKKSGIGRLVEVWCLEKAIPFNAYGSWTLENKAAGRGLEPDECYVFGRVEAPERPDLAIEVVWSSGGIDKLAVYRKLLVREVWIWKGGRIQPYALEGEDFVPIEGSRVLPGLDLDQLASFLDHPTLSDAIIEYRAALRKG